MAIHVHIVYADYDYFANLLESTADAAEPVLDIPGNLRANTQVDVNCSAEVGRVSQNTGRGRVKLQVKFQVVFLLGIECYDHTRVVLDR